MQGQELAPSSGGSLDTNESMKNFARGYIMIGFVGALLFILLDAQAFFSLFGYFPLYCAALVYGVVGAWQAAKEIREYQKVRISGVATLTLAFLMIALCFALPRFRTSPRKSFHVDAASLMPGMSIAFIESKMRSYATQQGQGYTAFVFRVDAHTEDRVIVDLAADSTARNVEVVTN